MSTVATMRKPLCHAMSVHTPSASSCGIGFRFGTFIGRDRNRWGRVAVADYILYPPVSLVSPNNVRLRVTIKLVGILAYIHP